MVYCTIHSRTILHRKHWVLIILQHHPVYKTWKGYIFDSRKGKDDDDYSCYEITTLFEQAIEENMTWAKVKVSSDSFSIACLFLDFS
ncbi:hypothetical protein HanXRQr2_Chr13g0613711 [Helianthus annuus]|uniref:Uncharacterized protein n=1 Tax=Helianthus annuus TaxID=4232 RepID=A0A9K3HEC3_HELAN|nr:hypothetical protein HanXRQr2_Chr13g0613711 [Helianthus annuus]